MKTKRVNVFNQEIREIRCVSNAFDYFGDGTVFTEDKLEVGTMYTLIKAEIHPYGMMVYLKEIENKYGFQDFLFVTEKARSQTQQALYHLPRKDKQAQKPFRFLS